MNRISLFLSCCLCLIASGMVQAQADPLFELYGQGVHAYFKGDLEKANELLSAAIDAGTRDPRVHYFRGLVQTRQSGLGSGLADYENGAQLEYGAERGIAVNVPKALERVQGSMRAEIEKVRQNARVAARETNAMLQRARMESIRKNSGAPAVPSEADGFSDGALTPGQPKEMPKVEEIPSDATVPAEITTTPDEPAADAGADPFGGDKTDGGDPFGDDAPAGDAPKGDDAGDDPFGN